MEISVQGLRHEPPEEIGMSTVKPKNSDEIMVEYPYFDPRMVLGNHSRFESGMPSAPIISGLFHSADTPSAHPAPRCP